MSDLGCCRGALTEPPTSGDPQPQGDLVCYCYEISADRADAAAYAFVRERVAAGECWCETKNPSGKCCLAELQRAVLRNAGQR